MGHESRRLGVATAMAVILLSPALLSAPASAKSIPVPIARPDADDSSVSAPALAPVAVNAADLTIPRLPKFAIAAVAPAADDPDTDDTGGGAPSIVTPEHWLYCVQFARAISGIDIQGDARTWWDRAKGLYDRMTTPEAGAVMVFAGSHAMRRGHVAVVKSVVSAREVIVDHANWGNDGRIYLNAPVEDVSKNNDWSLVRVWNTAIGQWGGRVYRIRGFVGS